MKQLKFALIFIALLFINNAVAQEATVPEPDFINVPAYFVKGTSDLKNFTKENATIRVKLHLLIMTLKEQLPTQG